MFPVIPQWPNRSPERCQPHWSVFLTFNKAAGAGLRTKGVASSAIHHPSTAAPTDSFIQDAIASQDLPLQDMSVSQHLFVYDYGF